MTAKTPQSAFDILTDLIEDPQDDGNYRLNVTGDELRELWKAVEDEKAELTQLRAENEHLKHERNRIAIYQQLRPLTP